MDLQLSDAFDSLDRIQECVARSDWGAAEQLARRLDQQTSPECLARYLAALKQTLIAAKSARANALASLARLNAAAEFQNPASPPRRCRNSAVSAFF
jgi:hypothetical protein